MTSKRRVGIVRRPAEYVLPIVIIVLIIVLVLSINAANKTVESDKTVQQQAAQEIEGTFDGISSLIEADIKSEESLNGRHDQADRDTAALDAAADNIGGVYDESEF